MKVSRYSQFDENENGGVEVSRQQHEQGLSHPDLYGGDADDVVTTSEASSSDDQPLTSSASSSRKMGKGKVLCITGFLLLLVIGASVGGYVAKIIIRRCIIHSKG